LEKAPGIAGLLMGMQPCCLGIGTGDNHLELFLADKVLSEEYLANILHGDNLIPAHLHSRHSNW
jgi:hypothetical protein